MKYKALITILTCKLAWQAISHVTKALSLYSVEALLEGHLSYPAGYQLP